MVDQLLSKKTEKYELIFYDNIYSMRYAPHLLNLYDYLDEDHIILYDREIILKSCVSDDKLVGIVNIIYNFFFHSFHIL